MGWALTLIVLAFLRLVALTLSFTLSTFCAALFITFVLFLGSDMGWLQNDPVTMVGSIAFATAFWLTIGQMTFGPACLTIFVLELWRAQSLTINVIAGGAVALASVMLASDTGVAEVDLPYEDMRLWGAFLSAGFIAGFAHWVLAGHRAGRWLGTPQQAVRD